MREFLQNPPEKSAAPEEWTAWIEQVGDTALGEALLGTGLDDGQFQRDALRRMRTYEIHGRLLQSSALGPIAAQALVDLYENTPGSPFWLPLAVRHVGSVAEPHAPNYLSLSAPIQDRRCPFPPSVRAILGHAIDAVVGKLTSPVSPRGQGTEPDYFWRETIAPMLSHGVLTGDEPSLRVDRLTIFRALELSETSDNWNFGQRLVLHAAATGLRSVDRAELASLAHHSFVRPNVRGKIPKRAAAQIVEAGCHWPEILPETVALVLDSGHNEKADAALRFACVPALAAHAVSRGAILRAMSRLAPELRPQACVGILDGLSPEPRSFTNAFLGEIPDALLSSPGVLAALLEHLSPAQLAGLDGEIVDRFLCVPDREGRRAVVRLLGDAYPHEEAVRDAVRVEQGGTEASEGDTVVWHTGTHASAETRVGRSLEVSAESGVESGVERSLEVSSEVGVESSDKVGVESSDEVGAERSAEVRVERSAEVGVERSAGVGVESSDEVGAESKAGEVVVAKRDPPDRIRKRRTR